MADDSDDVIYVDVKARLDEASADEAEGKLRDKFKDATKDIGESFKEATKSIGDHFKDLGESLKHGTLHDIFKDVGGTLGDELKKTIGIDKLGDEITKEIAHGNLGGALDRIGDKVANTTDLIQDLGEVFGVHLDGVGSVGKTITNTLDDLGRKADTFTGQINSFKNTVHAFRSGDLGGGLSGVHGLFGDVPGLAESQNFLDQYQAAHGQVKETADTLKDLALLFGGEKAAGWLAGTLFAPEVTIPAAIGAAIGWGGSEKLMPPSTWGRYGASGTYNPSQAAGIPEVGVSATPDLIAKGLYGPLGAPGVPTTPSSRGDMEGLFTGGRAPAPVVVQQPAVSGGKANVEAQSATVETGSATVMAGSVSLGGVSLPGAGGSHFDRAPSMSAPTAIPGRHSWFSTGGVLPGGSPGYDNLLGSVGGTPIGLEGGEFVVNPDATRKNLGLLQAINASSHFDTGGPVDPADQDKHDREDRIPGNTEIGIAYWDTFYRGIKNKDIPGMQQLLAGASGSLGFRPGEDGHRNIPGLAESLIRPGNFNPNAKLDPSMASMAPIVPTFHGQFYGGGGHFSRGGLVGFAGGGGPVDPNNPTQPLPSTPGGGGNQPKQQQDIGTGKGMSVGGGMLGMAEQAGAMAAGPLAPVAQIAEQEGNLAVQKLTQMAAVAAMAPIETFWLGGGQMGAPAIGSPAKAGWMGKLLGGVIGQGTNLPNIAGTVQPPKQPHGQPGEQDIHAQGGPPNQAPGPQGTKDDPMHVKNVGGQQGPPQGSVTSNLSQVSPSALLGT